MDLDEKPYRIEERAGAHVVTDEKGTVVLACADETSAERHAATLNEAWKRGFRTGYRAGRAS